MSRGRYAWEPTFIYVKAVDPGMIYILGSSEGSATLDLERCAGRVVLDRDLSALQQVDARRQSNLSLNGSKEIIIISLDVWN
jgi:hypothetical protein